MQMQVMDASDIRWPALTGQAGEGHGGEANEHGSDAAGYSLETFRLAVIEGQHPDGKLLKRDMPRWKMSDKDLGDLFDYLKNLS